MSSPSQHALVPVSNAAVPAHLRPTSRARAMIGGAVGGAVVGIAYLGAAAFGSSALAVVALVSAVAASGFLYWRRRSAFELVRRNDDAVALLNAGQVDAAEQALTALLEPSRPLGWLHALTLFNLSVCWLRRGDPLRAIPVMRGVHDAGWLKSPRLPYQGLFRLGLATANTMSGNFADARRWLDLAQQVTSPGRMGQLMPTRAMLAAREGRLYDALAEMDAGWLATEGVMPAGQMRQLRVLRAYCLASTRPGGLHDPEVRRSLDAAMPLGPWDLAGWCRVWPQFHAFVYETLGPAAANGPG